MSEIENTVLLKTIISLIDSTKENTIRSIDFHRVQLYWNIGKHIFEEQQEGKDRADYGQYVVKYLSTNLKPIFGSGYSSRQLYQFIQFYKTFPIVNAVRSQLNWSQYRILIALTDEDKRTFYIAESIKNHWTGRQMERQINSSLYERLLLSNDKESVLAVAKVEKYPSDAREIIKDPITLEFLGLRRETAYYETNNLLHSE
ncbi:DUF1016 N-terminal domain-containing protein [Flavobacterium sp. 7A]|uniref:DUF1016 N-terminal domain-containing protein n=1 Tax=Flavobacterium sp. 7A TaxID=2940571 RepID=UPI0022275AC2|nr:DUF1016 N-terminal domain-containing protein [Flavobacterium sp. 7A]MCW2119207.1 hypothetical protein [Flavobacterium sp. 7A]